MPEKITDTESDTVPAFALGRQLTLEYYDCAPRALLDEAFVERALLEAAEKSGATVISSSFHRFEPQGVSGVVVIAESHLTVHAWPEHDYAAVDIFTCGDKIDLEKAIDLMQASFGAKSVVISSDMNRGLLSGPASATKTVRLPAQVSKRDPVAPTSWGRTWKESCPWGVSTTVDLYGCDQGIIKDFEKIKTFPERLCRELGLQPDGECRVDRVDKKGGGVAMVLPGESAMITARFPIEGRTAYLDIFSTGYYEPRKAAEFALSTFMADHYKMQTAVRQ